VAQATKSPPKLLQLDPPAPAGIERAAQAFVDLTWPEMRDGKVWRVERLSERTWLVLLASEHEAYTMVVEGRQPAEWTFDELLLGWDVI
jgi:hypothetical protein